jgi:hypothetical protein
MYAWKTWCTAAVLNSLFKVIQLRVPDALEELDQCLEDDELPRSTTPAASRWAPPPVHQRRLATVLDCRLPSSP